ncbi:phospho-N-acetylmuramoyl-pentapeptide-transferase homolog [Andrographis paniculata]|uniref:phospho-N-acetylmuramoyl-pentapeptide- transferase homolog n=1 Tax=Andrographis paniculata TaxID=175694 RepID=UPI0021E7A56B|nr:phospho-N-acetylmuramoyl-pentapeptide-transferase homolog [Andrographis paniculata]XP_051143009.1 phospho-N-acetylmuramoyl-pentapeptide-transferase homolog [Andrographis paniculata]
MNTVMQSQALCYFSGLGLMASLRSFSCRNFTRRSYFDRRLFDSRVRRNGFRVRRRVLRVSATDDDSGDVSSFSDMADSNRQAIFASTDGEASDGEAVSQLTDDDSPSKEKLLQSNNFTRTTYGVLNNVGLTSFSTFLLLFVDHYTWRIARLPLPSFYLMQPFLISIVSVCCAGYICAPLLCAFELQSPVKNEVPPHHSSKKATSTMGGLYLVPIGILVAESVLSFSSVEVSAAAMATICFAVIGLLDDFLRIKINGYNPPGWIKVFLEVSFGLWFSHWFCTKIIVTPYNMKMGKSISYPLLTTFFFISMPNGIKLTDGLDGLAVGTAALAFVAMSIVVLPICCKLSVFGASMAGACIGFLFQHRYSAPISMGATGALALGGALAAMASCTGMFLPLLIASGVFVLASFSAVFQGHLRLHGIKEPVIVAASYVAAAFLSLFAAYVGLSSPRLLR